MSVSNDDLLFLEAGCKALDADPEAFIRVPRRSLDHPRDARQYYAVEKGLLRRLIAACRKKEPSVIRCRAAKDGDCIWEDCPQLRDGEPRATGRHCPLDGGDKDDEDTRAVCKHPWHRGESMVPSCPGCGAF